MLMKKAMKGELPLMAAAKALQDEIMSPSMSVPEDADGVLAAEARACAAFKKVVLMVAGTAMQRYGTKIEQEQEVLSFLADILIDTYAAESAVLRAQDAAAAASCRTPSCTRMRRGSPSTNRPAASSWRRAAPWRRWPMATCCARSWRRSAGC